MITVTLKRQSKKVFILARSLRLDSPGRSSLFGCCPKGISRDLVLLERTYELSEVRVTNGGEDPAYSIMRHVIANAPYYRTQVKSYTAGTYLKGTGPCERDTSHSEAVERSA